MHETNFCPCCGRHCDLNEPHCDRGREYKRTKTAPENTESQKQQAWQNDFLKNDRPVTYDTSDINNKLILNLRDLGHTIRFLYEGKGSQKRILILLRETGDITQRELTERLGIQPGSASEVIGKLESAGLILRTPSETDRRTADIKLTPEGLIQAEEAARQREIRHQDMFSHLTAEEKDTLFALTEKLNDDWNKRYREYDKGHGHPKMHGKGRGPQEHYSHPGSHHHHE